MLDLWLAASAILLNEVLYDPAGADAGREFVELLNPSDAVVPLAGLVLEAGDGARPGTWRVVWRASGGQLGPGAFYVVAGESLAADARLETELQNGPDALRLARDGMVLDRLGYGALASSDLFETRPAPDVSGQSLARWPDGRDTDDNGVDFIAAAPSPGRRNQMQRDLAFRVVPPDPTRAWPGRALTAQVLVHNLGQETIAAGGWSVIARLRAVSGDSVPAGVAWPLDVTADASALAAGDSTRCTIGWIGIPGLYRLEVTSRPADEDTTDDHVGEWIRVGAGPIVVNEILYAPVADAPEWVELWNRDDRAHDLRGWTLSDASGRAARLAPPRRLVAGAFAIVARDTTTAIAGLDPAVTRAAATPWNSLNNSDGDDGFADWLVLRDGRGVVVDAVRYSAAWGGERGRSLERLVADPDVRGVLWAPCKTRLGSTPGGANSAAAPPGNGARVELAPNPFSPNGDGHDDLLGVGLEVPIGCDGFRARLFDLEGRCRVRLAADRLGPGPRHLAWDGRADDGTPLSEGVYIIHFEFDAKSGSPLRVRRVVGLVRR